MRSGRLEEANIGDIVHFVYLQPNQGEHERLIRVVDIRDTVSRPITSNSRKYYRQGDKYFRRARKLVTGEDIKTGEVRSFYADQERTSVTVGII